MASAILQATPLVVVAGAAIFFGETVGWRRWTAIVVGFVGVLVILRPGLDGFTLMSLVTVVGLNPLQVLTLLAISAMWWREGR